MAVTLLFKPTAASIGSLELDASVTETHSSDVDVTDHPVEKGSNISDHARPKPDTLQIEGMVSNTPIPSSSATLNRLTAGSVQYDTRSELQPTRAGEAYQKLLEMKDSGDLITVVTGIRSYENMKITSLSVPRSAQSGQALRFTVTLKQVRVVTSQTVKVNTINKAKPKTDLGKKAAPETDENTKRKSFLKVIKDSGKIQSAVDKFNRFLGLQ